MLLLSYFFAYYPYGGIIWIDTKKAQFVRKGKQIDARAKYDKQIIVLPTIRFRSPPARRGIINQTESHAARIAILPTRTMDADRIRALIPTFSWGNPTMAAFRPHDPRTSAVLRFPTDHFGSCSSLRLRASSRAHSQCAQSSSFITGSVQPAATCDYTFSANKNQRYEIVKLSSITLCSPCHTKIENTAFAFPKV